MSNKTDKLRKAIEKIIESIEGSATEENLERFNLAFEILSKAGCDWSYKDRKTLALLSEEHLKLICDKMKGKGR
jgi:hypothetical protein